MALQTLFLEIYIALLCINAGILIVDSQVATPLITPFDSSTVIAAQWPAIFNDTAPAGTFMNNVTSLDVYDNSTIGDTQVDGTPLGSGNINPVDTLFYPITILWSFVQFMTGGFVWDALGLFGFPSVFVVSLKIIIGALATFSVIYYLTGR
jgi:hypothetical protein